MNWIQARSIAKTILLIVAGAALGLEIPPARMEEAYQGLFFLIFASLFLPVLFDKPMGTTFRWALNVQIFAFAFVFGREAAKHGWI